MCDCRPTEATHYPARGDHHEVPGHQTYTVCEYFTCFAIGVYRLWQQLRNLQFLIRRTLSHAMQWKVQKDLPKWWKEFIDSFLFYTFKLLVCACVTCDICWQDLFLHSDIYFWFRIYALQWNIGMSASQQQKVDMLRNECEEMRQREKVCIEACQRDADLKVQMALAPFRHLPQEIESLKAVMELRNQEIHDLRRQKGELERRVRWRRKCFVVTHIRIISSYEPLSLSACSEHGVQCQPQ